jgi:MFS family permease
MGSRVTPNADVSRAPFFLLEGATLLSATGNGVALVVLPWLVLERTGDASAAGLVAGATAVPLLASSLFSGTIVDMVGRRRSAVVSDVLSCLSAAAVPVVDHVLGLNLGLIMVLAVIGAVFDPAGVTARETMLPAVARRAGFALDRVNSIHEANWGVAFLIGPGVGGLLIATIGAVQTLWITAGAFACSSVFAALIRVDGIGRPAHHERPEGMWSGTKEGFRFVLGDRLLRPLMLVTAVLVSAYMPIEGVVLPVFYEARDEPGRLGLLLVVISAGGILGSLGYGFAGRRFRRSLVFRGALLFAGIFVLAMAVSPPYPLLLFFGFGLGLAYGPVGPLQQFAMQSRTPERLRGRVMGILASTEYAAGPLGYLAVGVAVERLGVRPTFLGLAVLVLAAAVVAARLPSLRSFDDGASSGLGSDEEHVTIDLTTAVPPVALLRPKSNPE